MSQNLASTAAAGDVRYFTKPTEFHFATAKTKLFSHPAPYAFSVRLQLLN